MEEIEFELKPQFATEEISMLAKENGFNELCLGFYKLSHTADKYVFSLFCEDMHYSSFKFAKNSDLDLNPTGRLKKCFTAPLWQQIIDWFREKYRLFFQVYDFDDTWMHDFHSLDINNEINRIQPKDDEIEEFQTYEEAREVGIKTVFNFIKENKL